jgi:hypothetical protein
MLPSTSGGFLTNKWFLYLVLFSAVFDLFYFYGKGDMYALTIFFIIGFLASFFSKNMVVILVLAIALTHLIRYGKNLSEGFEGEEEKEDEAFEGEEDKEDEAFEGEEEDKEEGFEGEEKEDEEAFEGEDKEDEEAFEDQGGAQALIQNQKKLMESMKSLEPMLAKAEGFLQTVAPATTTGADVTKTKGKKDGFTTLDDAYKLLTPK